MTRWYAMRPGPSTSSAASALTLGVLALFSASCAPQTKLAVRPAAEGPAGSPTTQGDVVVRKAQGFVAEFERLCAADGGKLWGPTLCGPLLLIDRGSRAVVANRADRSGLLAPRDGAFVGAWPNDLSIANTAVEWQGTRWTMIELGQLDGDLSSRRVLMMHEAFHRIEPELGLEPKGGSLNRHLDTRDGRFWMQFEWNALQVALGARGEERLEAISDALTFRGARHARFPDSAALERPLEIFEGLAEYSGARLAGLSNEDVVKAAGLRRGWTTSLVRGFAYLSGPLYGFLLDGSSVEWRSQVTLATDLGALLAHAAKAAPRPVTEAERRAARYGGVALGAMEDERQEKQLAQVAEWRRSLVDGPVLIVDKKTATSGTFDPNKLFPLSEAQFVCTSCSIIADWGTLTVEDGAMFQDDTTGHAQVSLVGATGGSTKGTGWSLELASGWTVVPGVREGDRMLVRHP